ncbi:unnamed protein product [Rhodiola kirilowii]
MAVMTIRSGDDDVEDGGGVRKMLPTTIPRIVLRLSKKVTRMAENLANSTPHGGCEVLDGQTVKAKGMVVLIAG